MSEEKEKPAQESKPEAKATEAAKAEGGEKLRKVSRMTLPEVEAELKTVKEKMGGFQSSFARHLLARKSELTK